MNKILVCPICASKNIKKYMDTKDYFFTKEDFSISQCNDCEFVFTNPIPTNLSKYYETTNYLSHNTADNGIMGILYSKLRNINIKRKYKLVTGYCKNGNLLDIGCGTAELINYFKHQNWNVTGVEPNESARTYTKNTFNIDTFEEDELNNFEKHSFDVITMWHVLEHVPNLHDRVSQLKKLLKPNGTMFIALPNLNSPDAKKYKQKWSALDVPRHLYHFTQNTFAKLIDGYNLKIVHAEPMKLDAYYVSMLSEKYFKNPFYLSSALINGCLSNVKAKKENNYSSMIYVVKNVS